MIYIQKEKSKQIFIFFLHFHKYVPSQIIHILLSPVKVPEDTRDIFQNNSSYSLNTLHYDYLTLKVKLALLFIIKTSPKIANNNKHGIGQVFDRAVGIPFGISIPHIRGPEHESQF